MHREISKTVTVTFKVEAELGDLLNQLPNKSDFIRKAISAQLGTCCPLCKGKGHIPRGVYNHFAPLISANCKHRCDGCGDDLPLPADAGDLGPEDQARLKQFFHGGPFYCDSCYDVAPPCGDCGWHVGSDLIESHRRTNHE